MARRVDFLGRIDGKQRTPQGGLRVPANLTRTGIFEYLGPKGETVREYRPPEEVFKADSLDTLKYAPIVIGHPDMVRADNWRDHTVGLVAENVHPAGIFVASDVLVQDKRTIDRIDSGDLLEFSCGYEVDLDFTPGTTPEGEKYDAVQRNIRYNHVGLGPEGWGRAGRDVCLHLDGGGNVVLASYSSGMTLEEALKALEAANKRADAAEAARDATTQELEQARKDAADARAELVTVRADSGKLVSIDQIPGLVAARVTLETSARRILGADASFTKKDSTGAEVAMTDLEVMTAAIAKVEPGLKLDAKSPDYVRARFDFAVERASREDAAHAQANASSGSPEGAPGSTAEKSRLDEANAKAEADRKKSEQAGPPEGAHVRK